MWVAANLAQSADAGTNVPVAAEPIAFLGVSKRERLELAKLTKREVTLVRVQRMLTYLREYPDRNVATFLEAGFRDGFHIPCVSVSFKVFFPI